MNLNQKTSPLKNTLFIAFTILGVFNNWSNNLFAQCQEPPKGWFVIICLNHTEASQVRFEIGVGGDQNTHRAWTTWTKGQPTVLSVPIEFRYAKEIWLKAYAIPEKDVSLCICFNDHVTQKMTFDEDEEHETNRDDDNECECGIPR